MGGDENRMQAMKHDNAVYHVSYKHVLVPNTFQNDAVLLFTYPISKSAQQVRMAS